MGYIYCFQVDSWVNHQHTEGSPQTDEDKINMAPDALSDIHDMQTKISEIEMAVKQMHESFKPKDELREIQRIGKSFTNIPVAENEVLTKDIILDQMCESSSYGRSRRGTLEADEMLELWETANKDSNSGLDEIQKVTTTGPADYHQRGATKEPKSEYTSADSLVEKELSVDKLEISKRLTLPREEDKRKLIERLDSDARKLANLQITVQDLMKKVETTEKSTKGKGMEYDNVIGQLKAAEEAITKLFDANRKQMKNVEEGSLSFIGNPEPESDESGSISRRVSEQARRGTEKIGRLQLEVQRLQFILLKLDDERERKGKTKVTDRSPRVLLRDYLYGGTRTNQKKKKAPFCSCVKPPTKGD